jgi:hypothetical protein
MIYYFENVLVENFRKGVEDYNSGENPKEFFLMKLC